MYLGHNRGSDHRPQTGNSDLKRIARLLLAWEYSWLTCVNALSHVKVINEVIHSFFLLWGWHRSRQTQQRCELKKTLVLQNSKRLADPENFFFKIGNQSSETDWFFIILRFFINNSFEPWLELTYSNTQLNYLRGELQFQTSDQLLRDNYIVFWLLNYSPFYHLPIYYPRM